MLQTLKVLRAAVALHEFTVDEVAAYAEVSRSTVRTVLRRHEGWFPALGTETTGRRGGQWTIHQASDEAAERVAQLLDEHREAVGADLDPPPKMPDPATVEARLGAVEHALLTPPRADATGRQVEPTAAAAQAIRSLPDLRAAVEKSSDRRLVLRFTGAQLLANTLTTDWGHATRAQAAEVSRRWTGLLDDLESVGLGALAHRVTGRLRSSHAKGVLTDDPAVPAVPDNDWTSATGLPTTIQAIGVELLPYRLVAIRLDERGHRIGSCETHFDDMSPRTAVNAIATAVDQLTQAVPASATAENGLALGVQLGGPVDTETGVVHYLSKAPPAGSPGPPEFCWRDIDFGQQLAQVTGLATVVENDANAFAMYELIHGIGSETDDFVVMLVREGIGGSVVKRGEIFPGPVEIGNFIFHSSGFRRSDAGMFGALEATAGTTAITDAVRERTRQTVPDIDRAADLADEDPEAVPPFRESGVAIKGGMAHLVSMCGPKAVVLYGHPAMFERGRPAADAFLAEIEMFRTLVPYDVYRNCSLTLRPIETHTGATGAAELALVRVFGVPQSTLTSHRTGNLERAY